MNNEEIQSLIEQLKASGLDVEEIMTVLYDAFKKGEMDRNDLETLASALGCKLTDEFKNDSQPDPMNAEAVEDGMSKEELEDAREINDDETVEEFKEKIESEEPVEDEAEDDADETPAEDEDEDEGEDAEWEKAQKMFRI